MNFDNTFNLIPINIITGFLGSGKTTLLSELLKNKELKNTAIIINEFGKIGIDHHLIDNVNENIIELQNGCVCCSIQSDLRETLINIFNRNNGLKHKIDRVIIETTGIADPLPISDTLINCENLQKIYTLECLITMVDAVNGLHTLRIIKEAVRQVYLSNVVIMSKTDLANENQINLLTKILKKIKSNVKILKVNFGRLPLSTLINNNNVKLEINSWSIQELLKSENIIEYKNNENKLINSNEIQYNHINVNSFAMTKELPINRKKFNFFVESLENQMGPYLLRVKGIFNIQGEDKPAVLHGSQEILHPIEWLSNWPDKDKSSRIVFITHDIKATTFKGFCTSLLDLTEINV